MKTKRIKIPIYYGELILIQSNDWLEINSKYGFSLNNSFDAITFKQTKSNGQAQYFAVFGDNPTLSIIAHEAVHIVNQIYIDRQMKLDPDNDEPQAYLTGWVVGEISRFIGK